MSGTADPAIGATYYLDDAFRSKKNSPRWKQSDRRDSGQSDTRGREYSLSRIPSNGSSAPGARGETSPRPRSRRRSDSRRRHDTRDYSPSPSPRRRSRSPPPRHREDNDIEKPWFKKKTFWATVASLASVASVAAVSMSAQATRDSAQATRESAQATKKSAKATMLSAQASTRIADAGDLSTKAVVNTAVANGHQDHRGRYLGPPPPGDISTPRGRRLITNGRERHQSSDLYSQHSRSSHGHHNHKPYGLGLLEYQPLAKG